MFSFSSSIRSPYDSLPLVGHTYTQEPWIANLVEASLQHGYLPECFREGIVAVVPKRDRDDFTLAKNWRPITLLCCIGKIIERIVTDRLAHLAAAQGWVPETQFAFCRRGTVDALEYLLNPVWKAWCTTAGKQKRIFSTLVKLDIKAAYDHVDRMELLRNLLKLGAPNWMIKWIGSFLSRRRARLWTRGRLSDNVWLNRGIPQGSPLSPILFILSSAKILELARSNDPQAGCVSLAFVDDVQILIQSLSYETNCKVAAELHAIVVGWAGPQGFIFDASKYTVLHFRQPRTHTERCTLIPLEGMPPSCLKRQERILGVIVDDELSWKPHLVHVSASQPFPVGLT